MKKLISQEGPCNVVAVCWSKFYSMGQKWSNKKMFVTFHSVWSEQQISEVSSWLSLKTFKPQDLVSDPLFILANALKIGKGVPYYNCCPSAEILNWIAFSSVESCLSQHKCRYKQIDLVFSKPECLYQLCWFGSQTTLAFPVANYDYFTQLEATWDLFGFFF